MTKANAQAAAYRGDARELRWATENLSADAHNVVQARDERDAAIKRAEAAELLRDAQKDMMAHYVERINALHRRCKLRDRAVKKSEARVTEMEAETKGLRGDVRAAEKDNERLRGQLESVADRAAAAETALEVAPAASKWRFLKVGETIEAGDEMTDDLFMPWCDAAPCVGQEVASGPIAFRRRVPAPAASGAAGTEAVISEVVAWGVSELLESKAMCSFVRAVEENGRLRAEIARLREKRKPVGWCVQAAPGSMVHAGTHFPIDRAVLIQCKDEAEARMQSGVYGYKVLAMVEPDAKEANRE